MAINGSMERVPSTHDLFVDTSGWAEYLDRSQRFHHAAKNQVRACLKRRGQLFTTNYIIAELVALLASPINMPRPQVLTYVENLRISPHIEIVHIDPILDDAAWQLLKSRTDKNWSLADAASFIVMREKGLTDAITTDHHFEQSGFVRLLK